MEKGGQWEAGGLAGFSLRGKKAVAPLMQEKG